MQRDSDLYLFSIADIPLPFNAALGFPVNNDNVQWQHSSNIPKYTNTLLGLTVRRFVFTQEFPDRGLVRLWFPPSQT